MHFIFIVNPISGKGQGKKIIPFIENEFKNKSFEIFISQRVNHIREFIQNKEFKTETTIVSCGGDGTLNEIASGIINKNVYLGIIPIGSGNGLARNLKIPLDPIKAIKYLHQTKPKELDSIKINEFYAFSNLGIGFDSQIIEEYDKNKQRGFIGYFKSSMKVMFKIKHYFLDLSYNKINYKGEVSLINISNSNQIGYNFSFMPDAKYDDGLMNILIIPKFKFIYWLKFGFLFIINKIANFGSTFTTNELNLKFLEKIEYIQIDGELIKMNTDFFEIKVIPKSIKILA